MNLKLDHLQIFVSAARQKSFSATARSLGRAQSAVSTAISDLEIDLGVELFDRSGRYPTLTAAGESMLAEAEAVLSHCDGLRDRASALARHIEPRVSLAVDDAFPGDAFASILLALHQRYPTVTVGILQPSTHSLLEMVDRGEAMLGLGCAREHYPGGIGFCRLGQVTMVNVAHRDHALSGVDSIGFARLADHLQLMIHAQSHHLLTSEYLKSPKRWYVQSHVMLIELLRQGVGWAMLPRRLVASELALGELVELKLKAYPFTEWTVGLDLLWRSDLGAGAVATWLKAELSRASVFV